MRAFAKRKRAPRKISRDTTSSAAVKRAQDDFERLLAVVRALLIGAQIPGGEGVCCSWTWADDLMVRAAKGGFPLNTDPDALRANLKATHLYPPTDPERFIVDRNAAGKLWITPESRVAASPMRLCRECGRYCPPIAHESDLPCVDCRENLRAPPDRSSMGGPSESTPADDAVDFVDRLLQYAPGLGVVEWSGPDVAAKLAADARLRGGARRLVRSLSRSERGRNLRKARLFDVPVLLSASGSVSAHAIQAMEAFNVVLIESTLAPEDQASLEREIEAAREQERMERANERGDGRTK